MNAADHSDHTRRVLVRMLAVALVALQISLNQGEVRLSAFRSFMVSSLV